MLLWVILGIVGVGLILFRTQIGVLLRGFWGLFVQDLAKTPEGAAAVYQQLIDKAQDDYVRAADTLQSIAGQLSNEKDKLVSYQSQLKTTEQKCEAFAKQAASGDETAMDRARMFANQRQEILAEIEASTANVEKLKGAESDAKEMVVIFEKKLTDLKKQKVKDVNDLKLNKQIAEAYNSLDELRKDSSLDKMADAVKEGIKEKKQAADGAKTVYNSKTSTALNRAEKEASKVATDDYLASLMAKHTKSDGAFEVKEHINKTKA